ncbi:mechanosensitive ion channel domain-containing protein [Nakamurella deserti]|uniref:mechanosensitive ion channel domain-containing protein n=1 Tax=Nakamurella deserti TaxID=2164074 RepID=UPI00197BE886|nr:mechanosensitive ion channel family protein [Nakamurella deserti]
MSDTPNGPTRPAPSSPAGARSDLPPVQETEGVSLMGALRNLDLKARPDLKRAVPALLVAILAFVCGSNLGGLNRQVDADVSLFGWVLNIPAGWVIVLVLGLAVVFVVFGVMAGRAVARELSRVSTGRAGVAAGSAIRLICLILTYLTVGLGLLALLQVDLGNLLVGGAVTGVVIGIAAQQTLGNFFAGLVLFFARPYVPGQRVKVHSGGLGGPFIGVIVGAGLLYTFIETRAGVVSLPNAGLLASAIGPPDDDADDDAVEPAETDTDTDTTRTDTTRTDTDAGPAPDDQGAATGRPPLPR